MEIRGPAPSATGGERPPGYALPVGIPCEGVALHTGGRAVWIGSLRAFPNGFDFVLRSV
ncbi:MAG: hypothetical protein HOY69_18535, partial [Streptomyces sp.]|nr:hypothetical protein [Streptomyces sp.]